MVETLASGRSSESPGEPVEVTVRKDEPGRYEVADGHHRIAEAIRNGLTHIDADAWPKPDDEPLEPPFYDFSQHMGPTKTAADSNITWHPKATKDLKALDRPVQRQVLQAVDSLSNGDPTTLAQTHRLNGVMKDWYSTKVSRGHRIIHQPNDSGGFHIGYVGLHEYEKAQQRLSHRGGQRLEEGSVPGLILR